MSEYYYQFSTFLNSYKTSFPTFFYFKYLVMKGCLKISLISILYYGFFLQIFKMKSFASSVTSTYSGNLISS